MGQLQQPQAKAFHLLKELDLGFAPDTRLKQAAGGPHRTRTHRETFIEDLRRAPSSVSDRESAIVVRR